MIFIDTGYLIALINPRDSLHARAQKWSSAIRSPLVLTEYVVLETVNYFSKPLHRPQVQALVTHIRNDPAYEFVLVAPELFDAAMKLHAQRNDKGWSLTDCVSFVAMRERKITRALTFDEHFEQAGFERLLAADPS